MRAGGNVGEAIGNRSRVGTGGLPDEFYRAGAGAGGVFVEGYVTAMLRVQGVFPPKVLPETMPFS